MSNSEDDDRLGEHPFNEDRDRSQLESGAFGFSSESVSSLIRVKNKVLILLGLAAFALGFYEIFKH